MQTRPNVTARAAGILSLITVLGGVFAQGFVSDRLVSFSDPALTATNILANRSLFQFGYTIYLIEMAAQIAWAAMLYRLLNPVNRNIALVATFVELAAAIFKTFTRVFYLVPLFVLSGSPTLAAFNTDQLRAIALLLLRINDRGAAIACAFFGISGLLRSYLVYRSTFLPRALGIIGVIASVSWLRFFYPPLRFPGFITLAILALGGAAVHIYWLIFRGVDEEKWRERYRESMEA